MRTQAEVERAIKYIKAALATASLYGDVPAAESMEIAIGLFEWVLGADNEFQQHIIAPCEETENRAKRRLN